MLSKLESRKECMEQIELIQHWNYFCSLAERLDDTKHYIDHGLQEHDGIRELVHGKVYSDIFKQIIVLAASEFEIMSKALCSAKGVKTKRIGDISETILGVFPKIIDFEVSTPFWINTPLHDWKTTRIDNGKNVKVEGLDWWFAYNSIKHDEKESIKNATFENAVLALCIFRKNCASVPEERSAIPLQTEQNSAGRLITIGYSAIPARKFKAICLRCHST